MRKSSKLNFSSDINPYIFDRRRRERRTICIMERDCVVISSEFVPVGSIDRKIYSKASRVSARRQRDLDGRVILLGKRQRAGGRGKRAGEQARGGGAMGEEICKKLYLRSSFRNIDPRERSYTGGRHREVFWETAASNGGSFSFLVYKQEPKRSSKRPRSLFHPRTNGRSRCARAILLFLPVYWMPWT